MKRTDADRIIQAYDKDPLLIGSMNWTNNIPQGAKSIIKQAIEEYKGSNDMGQDELGLLERFIRNLGEATAPTTIFGANPNAPAGFKGEW